MSALTQNISDMLSAGGERRAHRLVDASMAAAALVATAEGDVSFSERSLVDQAIDAFAERGETQPHEAASAFQEFVDGIRANSSQGRKPVLAALTALDGAAEAADVVLRIAEAVAAADGEASAAEIEAIQEIATALNAAAR